MGLLDVDQPTTLTTCHRQLIKLLTHLGFTVDVEVSFPPKWVDCYLPDYHVAFEADGPHHSRAKDEDRDAYLMSTYALPVYHLRYSTLKYEDRSIRALVKILLAHCWQTSVTERRMIAWKAGALQDG